MTIILSIFAFFVTLLIILGSVIYKLGKHTTQLDKLIEDLEELKKNLDELHEKMIALRTKLREAKYFTAPKTGRYHFDMYEGKITFLGEEPKQTTTIDMVETKHD